jgi:hypothetical protein
MNAKLIVILIALMTMLAFRAMDDEVSSHLERSGYALDRSPSSLSLPDITCPKDSVPHQFTDTARVEANEATYTMRYCVKSSVKIVSTDHMRTGEEVFGPDVSQELYFVDGWVYVTTTGIDQHDVCKVRVKNGKVLRIEKL